jgi:hypothetical protein
MSKPLYKFLKRLNKYDCFKGKNYLILSCLALLILIFAGCATKIALQAQRTPNLDTVGIKRIAVMPFEFDGIGVIYKSAAQHAANVTTDKIRATNHFTLIDPAAVNNARRSGRKGGRLEDYVDAEFKGRITRIEEQTTPQQGQYKDKNTGEMVTYTYYIRQVEVELSYSFTRARDGALIGPVTKKGTANANANTQDELPSVNALAAKAIENGLAGLHRDVAPYTITIQRSLEKEPDKALKTQMDEALAYVKGSNYTAACRTYLAIWESQQSVAAAVNASILYEAMGETQNAANFMQQVVTASGSPLAGNVLARLNRELGEKAGVAQFADTQNQVQRAAGYAVVELQKILPAEAKLLILNNAASNHKNLADDVVDNMISIFSGNGVAVVERQMLDKATEELIFQRGGSVNDEDIVSVGNFAGANTIIFVSITGSGASRRLQVRALDIGTGTVILQSGSGKEWYL